MIEDAVLIKAMRDSNVPKFLSPDLPLFYAIIGDLFPGIDAPFDTNNELKDAVVTKIHDHGLQDDIKFVNKIIQLFHLVFELCLSCAPPDILQTQAPWTDRHRPSSTPRGPTATLQA